MEESIQTIVNELDGNTMFRLSLGSKELFHSNFLEFLWGQDKDAFLTMLRKLLPEDKKSLIVKLQEEEIEKHLQIARERENLDLCIYYHVEDQEIEESADEENNDAESQDIEENHNDEEKRMGKNDVYCIIIENKVKSIPYKSQLDGYINKVNKQNQKSTISKLIKGNKIPQMFSKDSFQPVYLLLSLTKEFSQKGLIEDAGQWNIIHYDVLAKQIEETYGVDNVYVNDYVTFIKKLDTLGEKVILSRGYDSQTQNSFQTKLTPIRLHDLYLKLRGSIFIGDVYERIKGKFLESEISFEKADRKKQNVKIFLSSTMNNGKATVDATIVHEKGNDRIFYVIQIEGDQYRHMINKVDFAKKCSFIPKGKKRTQISEEVVQNILGNGNEFRFLNFEDSFDVKDLSKKKLHENYCKYQPNIIYRYKELDGTLESMLETMVSDIEKTCQMLGILK